MKFSISNIAWPADWDKEILTAIQENGFHAIEIAPNRTLKNGYLSTDKEIFEWNCFYSRYFEEISSMQSLLFKVETQIFESDQNMRYILDTLEKGLVFASKMKVKNIVFGSPSIRNVYNEEQRIRSVLFFRQLSELAMGYQINVSLEPNPKIYNTNFINSTYDALEYVRNLNILNFGINLDFGTIIENNELIGELLTYENINFIKHVHISEPFLFKIDFKRKEKHINLLRILNELNYKGYVSIEMKSGCSCYEIVEVLEYIKAIGIEAGVWNEK